MGEAFGRLEPIQLGAFVGRQYLESAKGTFFAACSGAANAGQHLVVRQYAVRGQPADEVLRPLPVSVAMLACNMVSQLGVFYAPALPHDGQVGTQWHVVSTGLSPLGHMHWMQHC